MENVETPFIATPIKKHKKGQIAIKQISRKEKIKMSNKHNSTAKQHKQTIKKARTEIKALRKAKRLAIKQARAEFKAKKAPQVQAIKMAKLLLRQVKTVAKLEKLQATK